MRYGCIILLILALAGPVAADDHVSLNEAGNKAYAEGKFEQALDYYHQAEMARPETPKIYYNEANTLVETGKYEAAVEKYQKALNSDDIKLQSDAYYNGGNGFFKQEDYKKAIAWYQKALELNPDDMDAKYNLELARNRLKEQMKKQPQDQQQQQQQDQQQQDQQQQDQEQEKDQQQQQDQQKQDQQQQQQNKQDQQQDQQQQEQKQEPAPQPQDQDSVENQAQQMEQQEQKTDEMSKEDALRILNALKDSDADNQKKQKRYKVQGIYRGNDW